MAVVGIPMYICATAATPIAAGLLVDAVAGWSGLNVPAQVGSAAEWPPVWLKAVCLLLLAGFMLRPVRRRIGKALDR